MKVTVTEWAKLPLVPVTPTCVVPADANVHDSPELPDPVTLVGDREQEVLLVVRATAAVNPFRPVIVMVEVPPLPVFTATLVGAAVTVKS